MPEWKTIGRPGFFGRRKAQKVADLNRLHGVDNWRLVWHLSGREEGAREFLTACKDFYEESYWLWFQERPEEVDRVCSYGECIDNAPTNVASGIDYSVQEASSTHIQDIAVRNVLARLGRRFEGPSDRILVIRSRDSDGYVYGPGNIPFMAPNLIEQPSKCPAWANTGSVEDFWQSNKFLQIRT